MTLGFVLTPPSNEFADAITRRFPPHVLHQAGANSESSLKRTAKALSSLKRTSRNF